MLPATQMLPIIQSGVQLRINGNHKFKAKDYKAALMMYMQAKTVLSFPRLGLANPRRDTATVPPPLP